MWINKFLRVKRVNNNFMLNSKKFNIFKVLCCNFIIGNNYVWRVFLLIEGVYYNLILE